jgi:hypothetical protein
MIIVHAVNTAVAVLPKHQVPVPQQGRVVIVKQTETLPVVAYDACLGSQPEIAVVVHLGKNDAVLRQAVFTVEVGHRPGLVTAGM